MKSFTQYVESELERARKKNKPLNSVHEGYAVILEELEEFWEQVRLKRDNRDKVKMYEELVQIAAMAQRTAEDVLELPMKEGAK